MIEGVRRTNEDVESDTYEESDFDEESDIDGENDQREHCDELPENNEHSKLDFEPAESESESENMLNNSIRSNFQEERGNNAYIDPGLGELPSDRVDCLNLNTDRQNKEYGDSEVWISEDNIESCSPIADEMDVVDQFCDFSSYPEPMDTTTE